MCPAKKSGRDVSYRRRNLHRHAFCGEGVMSSSEGQAHHPTAGGTSIAFSYSSSLSWLLVLQSGKLRRW